MTKKLYIVDGYGFVFRAYHSMPPLTNSEGTPVGAIYGFTNMLLKVLKEHKPDFICVALDSGKETFRTEIYPAYKANRPPAPDDLIPQFPLVRDAISALGIKSFEMVGYEADDIIATFTRKALEQDIEVTIISSDKDLMQLVHDGKVQMYDAMRAKFVHEKEVFEKFGVAPNKVLDACALIGDSSDNVPGAAGIGPKTAAELMNEYGDLDSLLARAGEIKQPKRREVLQQSKEQILMSRELIRLHYDVPIEFDFASLSAMEYEAGLADFCRKHGFKSLLGKLTNTSQPTSSAPVQPSENKAAVTQQEVSFAVTRKEISIKSQPDLKNWLGKVTNRIAIYFMADVGVALATATESVFIKFASPSTDLFAAPDGISKADVDAELKNIYSAKHIVKIFFDYKGQKIRREEAFDDLQVMEYVVATGLDAPDFAEEKLPKKPSDDDIKNFAIKRVSEIYDRHTKAKQALFDARQLTVYEKIEKPLIGVLAKMEAKGAKIDASYLANMSADFVAKLAELEKEIFQIAGMEFNIASPAQIGEVLFEKMGLEGGKKSKKTGNYSTGADILEELALEGHLIAEKILQHRQLSKLKSTYTDALPEQINPKTGRVHTTFMMTVANTGRLSSQHPNLQNIPIRSEEGRKIRNAFIAEKGYKLISADYSQIELRLLADVADIKPLKDAFKNGEDIHTITAHQVFGSGEVTPELRRMAKAINFGIIYGQSAHGLAKSLGIPRQEAASYIEQYFKQYAGIKNFMNDTIQKCKEYGFVETILGRRLYIKDINNPNGMLRQFSERAAINAPLQGSAADIIKLAMLELDKQNFPMTLQVHDELLFEVPENEAEQAAEKIKHIMENAVQISVPLTVEVKIGNNWGEVH